MARIGNCRPHVQVMDGPNDPQCQLENGYGQWELTNGRVPLIAPPFNQRRTSPMRNLNHERHVPHPVQSHNGQRISHPHRIAMNNFTYPLHLVFGDGEGFVAKIRSNKTERKWPTNNKTRKERNIKCESNISYLVRHCLNLDSGWRMSIHRLSFPRPCEEFEL